MKKIIFFVLFILTSLSYAGVRGENSPVGYWQTLDDVTGKPKAVLQIEKQPNQTLSARIVKIYPDPGHVQKELCEACEGDKHNQPILGMQIMEGVKQDKENWQFWANGKILDPSNGKVYHCNLQLIDGNQKLLVRGYIGVPLFGRSQKWVRIEKI
jgi:uncharacterized protein (DUF2147 family)